MLSLPGAGTYQYNSHGCVSNEVLADFLANRCRFQIAINYVSDMNRSVYYIVSHHLNESIFVLLVLIMVVTDEDLVSLGLRHGYFPSTCSKRLGNDSGQHLNIQFPGRISVGGLERYFRTGPLGA